MTEKIIQVTNLSYVLNHHTILNNINFAVHKADYIALLGPNGGGKTTLIKLILGILKPTSGKVTLFESSEQNPKSKIGYVPQRLTYGGLDFPATVREIVQSGLFLKQFSNEEVKGKTDIAMNITQIKELGDRQLSDLSGGQRQKVFIARSLINDPQILILDEPTVAIDIPSQANFYSFLQHLNKEMKITIILISHDISAIAKEVSKIYYLDQSLVCYHNTKEFVNQDNLDKLYGKNINLISYHH